MRFLWFEVQGYKNIRAPLRLAELGRINVLHGDNNVGKSNLLEAIGLFFVVAQAFREDARGGPSLAERFALGAPPVAAEKSGAPASTTARSLGYFSDHGFPVDEIFNVEAKLPIELRASLQLGARDLGADHQDWLAEPIEISVRLERRDEEIRISLTKLTTSADDDAVNVPQDRALLFEHLSPRRRGGALSPRFALLRADRTLVAEPMPATEGAGSREPISRDLGLALYDASEAADPRFARLLAALEAFRDLTGEGQWRAYYDRRADRADLRFEGATSRLPLRLMGSGVQQIVNLVARLVMTSADILAVEEPELNLRYTAQLRLRDVLARIVDTDGEPSQLLLTSHSPAFEQGPTFYALTRGAEGPSVTRRPSDQAREFTIPEMQEPPAGARAPLSYVTSDGLVLVPEDVRKALGLEHGGGVYFIPEKDDQHYRMLTNAQFWDLFEPRE